jgi:predicted Ser/Thr protein kinase
MTPQQWERLKTLFHGALEQPASTRRQWLASAAADDPELLREAEALLHANDTAAGFLEEPIAIDPSDLIEPRRFGPYEIEREIGRGGMGVVYLARDARLGRHVAIKSLPPAVAASDQLRERLRREARAAATISHPCVAVVYALEEIDDHLLLVTEYVAGRTLRSEIDAGAIPPPRALAIAADIAQALIAAHDAGVVHRDLKPENVIVTPAGGIKVVDFGIAHLDTPGAARLTIDGALLGTPAYMAPEQMAGEPVDARTDIHAAGTVLFEMLTGRHPMNAGSARQLIPASIAAIIDRCLQHDPDARYASARDLSGAIEAARRADAAAPALHERSGRWWWEFHQAVVALAYWVMVIPAWTVRAILGGWTGRAVFIAVLASVIVAANLRLHLWFTSRFYATELRWLRGRVANWILVADWIFALTLIVSGLIIGDESSPFAILMLSFGIGAGVAFLFIEPATTRATFRKKPGTQSN